MGHPWGHWGPCDHPVIAALHAQAEILKTAGAWCDSKRVIKTCLIKKAFLIKGCVMERIFFCSLISRQPKVIFSVGGAFCSTEHCLWGSCLIPFRGLCASCVIFQALESNTSHIFHHLFHSSIAVTSTSLLK